VKSLTIPQFKEACVLWRKITALDGSNNILGFQPIKLISFKESSQEERQVKQKPNTHQLIVLIH
jgi:hypothetical protein